MDAMDVAIPEPEVDLTLDTTNSDAQRQVWLVKIPAEVHDAWKNAKDTDCVATVRLYESYAQARMNI